MLKTIKIKGYKSIRTLELPLKPLNILIGSNGVGKSNFISFFKLVNNIYEQRLKEFSLKSGVDALFHYGRKNTTAIEGYLDFGENAYNFILKPTDEGALFIEREDSIYHSAPNNRTFFSTSIPESEIKESERHRDLYLRDRLKSYKIYHIHDTSQSAPLRSVAKIDDNRVLKEDGGNLPAYLYYLQQKHPKTFKRIEKTIASVVPFFERFDLKPDRLNEQNIKLVWLEKGHSDTYFDATHLSDGGLRFMALTTLLMQPNLPKIIIIDEPELGLHPFAINKLAGLLQSAAARDCQVIVSTQSVNLLNNFEPQDIITVDKDDHQSVYNRLDKADLQQWLSDYSIGDLWMKNVIKGQPY